ncbi:ABC transporter permease [Chengkuizengella axinellae]|uniref:ABC transporter permease n=1 Tax=Chengkuizengella axinellae TaxID=3064388 RepID=A0ABT9J1N5_9BACL|nr:ABC transporter permease [Chengkuizengella sp. 2205SS18-9]MDP5275398.1 ABC transporter permease [Chengkuizengella sp. 2205SS18-9]
MTFSLKRVNAIFMKDYKDLLKNSYVLFTIALPIFYSMLLSKISDDDPTMTLFPINLALIITGAFIQAAIVAEEKEKNTLRGLLLSPASTLEILVGKSALTAVVTLIVILVSVKISGLEMLSIPFSALLIALSLIFYLALGTMLGLLSRTVMETSIIGMPFLLLFGMMSMFKPMFENELILNAIGYLPNEQFAVAWVTLSESGQIGDIVGELIVLTLWALAAVVITVITYGKRRFD